MTPATLERRRKQAALNCARKLDTAVHALQLYLRCCDACNDGSGSLSAQGKGVDGREVLIRDLSEYSGYLESVYKDRA